MQRIGLAVVLMTGFLLVPLVAEAQGARTARIGFLSAGPLPSPNPRMAHVTQALRDGLADSGFVENQSVTIEYRWAEEKEERLPVLAAELVRHSVDVIIAAGPSAIRAAKSVTGTLPVVGIDLESDPVAAEGNPHSSFPDRTDRTRINTVDSVRSRRMLGSLR